MEIKRLIEKETEEILMALDSQSLDILAESVTGLMKVLPKVRDTTIPSHVIGITKMLLLSEGSSSNARYMFDKMPRRENQAFGSKKKRKSPETDSEEEIKYKEKKKRIKTCVPVQLILPEVLQNRIREMNGYDIKLLIQKNVFNADLSRGQNRFSIPVNQIRDDATDFLTKDEEATLNQRFEDNHVEYLEVPLIEPNLQCTIIKLRKWNLKSSHSYMLSNPWHSISVRNNLEEGMIMQVWSFRVDGKLHLALVNLSAEKAPEGLDSQS